MLQIWTVMTTVQQIVCKQLHSSMPSCSWSFLFPLKWSTSSWTLGTKTSCRIWHLSPPKISLWVSSLCNSIASEHISPLTGGLMPSHCTSVCTGWDLFSSDVIQLLYSDRLDDSITKSMSLLFSQCKLITAASFLSRVCCELIACYHRRARKHPLTQQNTLGYSDLRVFI